MAFRFLEDIATADVAFEATGKTPKELFVSAAEALEEAQVDTKQLAGSERRAVNLENKTLDELLFDFLNELIYLKDAESLVFKEFKISVYKLPSSNWGLKGTLSGETLDPTRHKLRTDVKAVTKHRFKVEETPEGFKATVVLDI